MPPLLANKHRWYLAHAWGISWTLGRSGKQATNLQRAPRHAWVSEYFLTTVVRGIRNGCQTYFLMISHESSTVSRVSTLVCSFYVLDSTEMLKQPQCKGLRAIRQGSDTHISSGPPSAVGPCRTAGRGQDGEQTPVCSPGKALTAAMTRGMTFCFVWTRGQR